MSEPKMSVINQVNTMKSENPFIYSEIWRTGFLDIYSTVNKNDPEKFVESLEPYEKLTENMCRELRSLWTQFFAEKYNIQADEIKKKDIYAEYMLLCMVAGMPRELYRIKATERRDNMRDIDGLLNISKVSSAIKTMETTMSVYIPRARELGLEILIFDLMKDRNSEFARFVVEKLITDNSPDQPPDQITIST